MLDNIIKILDDKKAMEIKTIDIAEKSILADHFVICTGTSSTHIRALADELNIKCDTNLARSQEALKVVQAAGYCLIITISLFTFLQKIRENFTIWKSFGEASNNCNFSNN